jgi:hypothetical protein
MVGSSVSRFGRLDRRLLGARLHPVSRYEFTVLPSRYGFYIPCDHLRIRILALREPYQP